MSIEPTETTCEEAMLTHFRLHLEEHEIENFSLNPEVLTDDLQDGQTRLAKKIHLLSLGQVFFENALKDCEGCEFYSSDSPEECPNIDVMGFIRDTLIS